MLKKMAVAASVIVSVAVLSGCKKEPPKCSDKETISIARNIILNQIGGGEGLDDKELEKFLTFSYPRASGYDEKIRKYTCETKLVIAEKYERPLGYASMLDDNGEHLVSVNRISIGDLSVMAALLRGVKNEKAQKTGTQ